MRDLTLEEVVATTRASRRNVKYWTALYNLPFRKDGRRNLYPPVTVTLLAAIALLSECSIFTTTYIRWLVDRTLGRSPSAPGRAARITRNWGTIANAFGATGLLPSNLVAYLATAEPSSSEDRQSGSDPTSRAKGPWESPSSSHRRTRDDDALL